MFAAAIITAALALAAPQSVGDVRQLYDAGKYQDVVRATATPETERAPRMQFLAAQSLAKLQDDDGARRAYLRVAESGETPWGAIGKSAVQVMDNQLDQALASADQAVSDGESVSEAHYQRGMVLMMRRDYGEAANAFAKTVQLDPNFAAAYYNAGLANSRIKRLDLTANNYEMFLKLAPNAPERPQVESILRTLRGR